MLCQHGESATVILPHDKALIAGRVGMKPAGQSQRHRRRGQPVRRRAQVQEAARDRPRLEEAS
ncbi:hypothetical protein [Paracoccus benzoatiresistens]|uniref:Uncharacterized protein n=1 Tax=Paracoccus benzoatiresistens TaxID=2997341 RepID=A0ABT4J888_9RHOB|nr:hypothetical protein [Paracoccus sp. EF6]MCZ0963129.1 hypothetical protein [Paracoccus sp. EF6]